MRVWINFCLIWFFKKSILLTIVLSSITDPEANLAAVLVWCSFQYVSESTPNPPHFRSWNLFELELSVEETPYRMVCASEWTLRISSKVASLETLTHWSANPVATRWLQILWSLLGFSGWRVWSPQAHSCLSMAGSNPMPVLPIIMWAGGGAGRILLRYSWVHLELETSPDLK